MPSAQAGYSAANKYWLKDHDTAYINITSPVQNQWYTVLQADDVRILVFAFMEIDLLAAGADFEIRWTLDGNVYSTADNYASGIQIYVTRNKYPSGIGTGLSTQVGIQSAMLSLLDKRALMAKLEIRIKSVTLATDVLAAWCVYETLEVT